MFDDLAILVERLRKNSRLIIADDYEFSVQRVISEGDRHHDGRSVGKTIDHSWWLGLRLLHRKRAGSACFLTRSSDCINSLIDRAFESASVSSPDPWFRLPLWKQPKKNSKESVSDSLRNPYCDSLFDEVESLCTNHELTFEEVHQIKQIDTFIYRKSEKFHLADSRHVLSSQLAFRNSKLPITLVERKTSGQMTDERHVWLAQLLERIAGNEEIALFSGTMSCPALFSPIAATDILRLLSPWLSADLIQMGHSPLYVDSYDQGLFFSKAVTLIDDGTLDGASQTMPFDMEGCLTQRTVLIEHGELCGSLYDSYSATRDNRISTGNFVRSSNGRPHIAPTNLYLEGSKHTSESLIRSIEDGILIDSFEKLDRKPGGSMADFVFEGFGWKISRGDKQYALHSVVGSFNLLDLMTQIVAVGDDIKFCENIGSPSVLVENLRLGQ